jgi:hypothetical protein
MNRELKTWLAGAAAAILAGVVFGLTIWSYAADHLLPDLSESPSVVSHYTRLAKSSR